MWFAAFGHSGKTAYASMRFSDCVERANTALVPAEVQSKGLPILHSFFDIRGVVESLERDSEGTGDKCSFAFRDVGLQASFNFLLETFLEERFQHEKLARTLWAFIMNHSGKVKDKPDRAEEKFRFTRTVTFLCSNGEAETARQPYEIFRAALDVCSGCSGVICSLGKQFEKQIRLPSTAGRLLLAGANCASKCGQNDFSVEQGKLSGHFWIEPVSKWAIIYVCPGSYNYVFYHHFKSCIFLDE